MDIINAAEYFRSLMLWEGLRSNGYALDYTVLCPYTARTYDVSSRREDGFYVTRIVDTSAGAREQIFKSAAFSMDEDGLSLAMRDAVSALAAVIGRDLERNRTRVAGEGLAPLVSTAQAFAELWGAVYETDLAAYETVSDPSWELPTSHAVEFYAWLRQNKAAEKLMRARIKEIPEAREVAYKYVGGWDADEATEKLLRSGELVGYEIVPVTVPKSWRDSDERYVEHLLDAGKLPIDPARQVGRIELDPGSAAVEGEMYRHRTLLRVRRGGNRSRGERLFLEAVSMYGGDRTYPVSGPLSPTGVGSPDKSKLAAAIKKERDVIRKSPELAEELAAWTEFWGVVDDAADIGGVKREKEPAMAARDFAKLLAAKYPDVWERMQRGYRVDHQVYLSSSDANEYKIYLFFGHAPYKAKERW